MTSPDCTWFYNHKCRVNILTDFLNCLRAIICYPWHKNEETPWRQTTLESITRPLDDSTYTSVTPYQIDMGRIWRDNKQSSSLRLSEPLQWFTCRGNRASLALTLCQPAGVEQNRPRWPGSGTNIRAVNLNFPDVLWNKVRLAWTLIKKRKILSFFSWDGSLAFLSKNYKAQSSLQTHSLRFYSNLSW